MTPKIKTNLKIAIATATCVFSLATLFTGTMAWFSMNQSVATTGMKVTVGKMSNINLLSCYAIRYDGNAGAIAFDISNRDPVNDPISMSEYDFVFKDRNVNTPLFIRMEMANFDRSKDLTITVPCTGSYKEDGHKIDSYLSNVVSVKFTYGLGTASNLLRDDYVWSADTGNGVTGTSVVNCYQGMLSRAAEISGTPFVSNGSKTSPVTITLNHSAVFNNSFIKQNGSVVVYIVFDYYVPNNDNLIDQYRHSYPNDDAPLNFTSDISTMTLENEVVL